MKKHFNICIKGQLPDMWSDWFDNMEVRYDGKNTILTGNVPDQSALHGILNRIRDLNLTLVSVNSDIEKTNNN